MKLSSIVLDSGFEKSGVTYGYLHIMCLGRQLLKGINGFWLQVGIPIKGYTLQCPNELFYLSVVIHAGVVACLNEMYHMLFRVALPVKLLEFWCR